MEFGLGSKDFPAPLSELAESKLVRAEWRQGQRPCRGRIIDQPSCRAQCNSYGIYNIAYGCDAADDRNRLD